MSQAEVTLLIAVGVGIAAALALAGAAATPGPKLKRGVWIAAAGPVLALLATLASSGLRFNFTPSMPVGVYRLMMISPSNVHRGMLVAVCAPPIAIELGRRRGYLSDGACPGGAEPLLKKVAGVAGDFVTVGLSGVSINGRVLRNSRPLATDCAGRPLVHWWPASRPSDNAIWLYADHRRSWDSRYWGPVPTESVFAQAFPVLVVGAR